MRSLHEKSSNESLPTAQRAGVLLKESSHLDPLLELQQTVGNQAVLRLLRAGYGQGKTLQKKCADCSTGATCAECGEEEKPDRAKAPDLGERTETLGTARCDLDQRKMVWQIHKDKIPKCMWKCAEAHELAHVKYGHDECSKVSAVYKKTQEVQAEFDKALAAAKKDPTKANVAKAEALQPKLRKAADDFVKASDDYKKWLVRTCRDDEKKAYQADIDACTGPKVEKQCEDQKEKDRYKKMMKNAEEFKKNPPNC